MKNYGPKAEHVKFYQIHRQIQRNPEAEQPTGSRAKHGIHSLRRGDAVTSLITLKGTEKHLLPLSPLGMKF